MAYFTALFRYLFGVVIAMAVTLALFLVLPLMQAISHKERKGEELTEVVSIPEDPPDDPVEDEEDPPPEPEDPPPPPPDVAVEPELVDLTALDNLLGDGSAIGVPTLDPTVNLEDFGAANNDLFDIGAANTDPVPRSQPMPDLPTSLDKRRPAIVNVNLRVDASGRVTRAVIASSTDIRFNGYVLGAVKRWRFDPAIKGGKPVIGQVRCKVEIPAD